MRKWERMRKQHKVEVHEKVRKKEEVSWIECAQASEEERESIIKRECLKKWERMSKQHVTVHKKVRENEKANKGTVHKKERKNNKTT